MDSRHRFSATADRYDRYRPGYPAALFDWLIEGADLSPGDWVADVGCGTGISTRLLGARGLRVVGIDPNRDMLAAARGAPGVSYVVGEASATGVADGSVRLVTAAQAFHWFPLDAALSELSRMVAGGGHCAAFWNDRLSSPFLDAYERLLRESSTEYERVSRAGETLDRIQAHPRLRRFELVEFPNSQRLDLEGLIGRAFSSSYVAHGVADPDRFEARLRELFGRFQASGLVEFGYRCVSGRFTLDRG